jgi:copper transport protein
LAGHASTGSDPTLGIALDVLHLAAVSVWVGGLVVLAALLLPGLPESSRPLDVRSLAMKFSGYAFAAVMVVVATGVLQSIRAVGSFYALFNTTYGVTLSVKVGIVIMLIATGAVSRRLVLGGWVGPKIARRIHSSRPGAGAVASAVGTGPPGARGRSHLRGLRRSVGAEIAIALVVLGVTALLVNAAPAKQAANQPFTQSFTALGVQINAIVAPAKTGPGNQVHFYVLGRQGQSVAIPELDAAISLPSEGIGPLAIPLVVASPGHFRASDFDIPLAGDWRLKITVRTSPIDEQELFTTVPIH